MFFAQVLNQMIILFILLIVGFILQKFNILGENAPKSFTSLILKVTLPAMIIVSMSGMQFSPELLLKSGKILLISFSSYFILILLSYPFAKLLFVSQEDAGIYRFSIIFSNVGFIGYPVTEAVFGKNAIFYTAILNLPFNLLAFTVGIIILLQGRKEHKIGVDIKHFLNPVVVSILIGFGLFLFNIKLPDVIQGSLDMLGGVTSPISMIVIGMLLARGDWGKVFLNFRLYMLSFFRLIVVPFATFFALRLFSNDIYLTAVPAMISAMPAAANTVLLAEEYNANAELASQAVFLTTLLSVATIPIFAIIVMGMK